MCIYLNLMILIKIIRGFISANYLIVGSPAKAIRELSEQELAWKKQGTHEYQVLVTRCKQTLHQVEPLREIEPGRKRLVFDENLRPKP